MKLTLRTMLAYLDGVLNAADAEDLGQKVKQSKAASVLAQRLQSIAQRPDLPAPDLEGAGQGLDPNTVAEYIEDILPVSWVADIEKVCLESSTQLAEVAACHQLVVHYELVHRHVREPESEAVELRRRIYGLPALPPEDSPSAPSDAQAVRSPGTVQPAGAKRSADQLDDAEDLVLPSAAEIFAAEVAASLESLAPSKAEADSATVSSPVASPAIPEPAPLAEPLADVAALAAPPAAEPRATPPPLARRSKAKDAPSAAEPTGRGGAVKRRLKVVLLTLLGTVFCLWMIGPLDRRHPLFSLMGLQEPEVSPSKRPDSPEPERASESTPEPPAPAAAPKPVASEAKSTPGPTPPIEASGTRSQVSSPPTVAPLTKPSAVEVAVGPPAPQPAAQNPAEPRPGGKPAADANAQPSLGLPDAPASPPPQSPAAVPAQKPAEPTVPAIAGAGTLASVGPPPGPAATKPASESPPTDAFEAEKKGLLAERARAVAAVVPPSQTHELRLQALNSEHAQFRELLRGKQTALENKEQNAVMTKARYDQLQTQIAATLQAINQATAEIATLRLSRGPVSQVEQNRIDARVTQLNVQSQQAQLQLNALQQERLLAEGLLGKLVQEGVQAQQARPQFRQQQDEFAGRWLALCDVAGKLDRREREQTEALCSKWLTEDPEYLEAHLLRGFGRLHSELSEGAAADFSWVLDHLNPDEAGPNERTVFCAALAGRGLAYARLGRDREAQADLARAKRVDRKYVPAYLLAGQALGRLGRYASALTELRAGMKLDSREWALARAAAWIYCTSPARDGKKALELAGTACELSAWKDWKCLHTLAAAHAEAGDFAPAQERVKQAIQLAPDEALETLLTHWKRFRNQSPLVLEDLPR